MTNNTQLRIITKNWQETTKNSVSKSKIPNEFNFLGFLRTMKKALLLGSAGGKSARAHCTTRQVLW